MKLIWCHIENFGKIHDYHVDFAAGLNTICQENGWGKSTFAAFIRAMLYGLDGDRKRSIEDNERKRYKPWQGGAFGGQLVFEAEGKKYRLSRIFHDKDINDEFELRDGKTNLPCDDYGKNIGEELFKLDRESFMRTIFISQNGCETTTTDDINAKLGNLADNTGDINNFDSANAKLTEIINSLTPSRVTGSLSKRKGEITRYERLVQEGQDIADSMEQYQTYLKQEEELYDSLKEQLKEAGDRQTIVSKQQAVAVKKSQWEGLKNSVAEKKASLEAAEKCFPGEIPSLEEVKKYTALCGDMEKAQERLRLYRISDSEAEKLLSLNEFFQQGFPEAGEIAWVINKANGLRELEQKSNEGNISSLEYARLKELEEVFDNETDGVATVIDRWNNRNNRQAALPSKQAALAALNASTSVKKQSGGNISPLFIIGAFLVVLGIAVSFNSFALPGVILALVGAVIIAIAFVKGSRRGKSEQSQELPEITQLKRSIDEDREFIDRTDVYVADYLTKHGRSFMEQGVSVELQGIMAEYVEYSSIKAKAERAENNTAPGELKSLQREVAAFLEKYGTTPRENHFSEDLYALKDKASSYVTLRTRQDNLNKAQQQYEEYSGKLGVFFEQYGYVLDENPAAMLENIREAVDKHTNLAKQYEAAKSELEHFEEENDTEPLTENEAQEQLPSLEEINSLIIGLTDKMKASHDTIIGYNKTLEGLQEKYDQWEESLTRLQELKELQDVEQRKYKAVKKAKEKLVQAKETLTAKYSAPILKGFSRYYEMISGQTAGDYHVDANTDITVDEAGKQRTVNTLSTGYRDMIGICMRLALVDAMYENEQPFIIMDDPFTNLDDDKITGALKFLEKLSENYQIIYFTCSNSRTN